MIDVSEILSDPDLCQDFTAIRSAGSFVGGRWTEDTPVEVPMTGVITVVNSKELQQIPEADQVKGAMAFFSADELFVTRKGETPGTSDRILWRGDYYRIFQVSPYADYGYFKAIGERMTGD